MIHQPSTEMVTTGVPGLDNVLLGGFLRGGRNVREQDRHDPVTR
jgi:hypothetical protein